MAAVDLSANDAQQQHEGVRFTETVIDTQHRYEELQFDKEVIMSEIRKFPSKYGITAPHRDFTDYNRQRSEIDVSFSICRGIHALDLPICHA